MLNRIIPLLMIVLALPFLGMAQATTGSLTGTITTPEGKPLGGASVVAIHVPSGTKYRAIATDKGAFNIPGMRVGGPYMLTIQYVGFASKTITDLTVTLGTPLSVNTSLDSESVAHIKDVTVSATGKGAIISSLRNGPSMVIASGQIQSLPSINNSVQDFVRFMPQVKVGNGGTDGNSTGISFGGQSNRYNKFTIDGANASDVFGLGSTGTNGGQANVNPISMEAIQEFQVILAPYDVTMGGFTGGGINAVTKSGANDVHGAAYGTFQNQSFVGKRNAYDSGVSRIPYGNFKNYRYGAGLGGAIIKNKLFYYVNFERWSKSTPLAYNPMDPNSGSKVNADTLEYIRQQMIKNYNYDPGTYGVINNTNYSTSVFARIDWNINDYNKLMLRFNHVNGFQSILSRSATTAIFSNSGYGFTDKNNSLVAELNSSFSSKVSNMLRVTYSWINDARTTAQFPNVTVYDYNPASKAAIAYNIGSDYSSALNSLGQKALTLTDNINIYKGNHTLTFGTDNLYYTSTNAFLQGFFGAYTYGATGSTADVGNINDFLNNVGYLSNGNPASPNTNTGLQTYQIGYSMGSNPKAPAILKAAQLSVYGQDVWSVTPHFKLTYGVRIDAPVFFNKPGANISFDTAAAFAGFATNQMPKFAPLFSPRIGFNWDVKGDATTQLRGGAGLFTGSLPFVWISNQYSNTGVLSQNISYTGKSGALTQNKITFQYDPSKPQMGAYIPPASNATGSVINVIDKKFKFPQVFRTNLGVDQKLGFWGLIGTAEAVFTKVLNNANYYNLNLAPNGNSTVAIGPEQRPYWSKFVNAKFGNVLELTNTSKGYGYNFTAQLQKPLTAQGWMGSVAYTYGHSTSLNDLPSSVAQSNWRGPVTVNGLNYPTLSTSNFNMGSRIVGFVSKEFKYAHDHASTTLTLTYTGQSGQKMSYVYGNNILGDYTVGSTSGSDALVYIPKSASEANFVDIKNGATASQQWANFQAFAAANSYLQKNAGKDAQRNGASLPFENHFDFRISETVRFTKDLKIEIYFSIMNAGNLVNKNWGWSYGSGSYPDGFYPLTTSLFSVVTSGAQKVDGVATTTPTSTTPEFQFNQNNFTRIKGVYRPYSVNDFTSRWNSQVGIRFSF